MSSLLFVLILGFILGIKHSFEADHIIAVSAITSGQKNPFKASLIGIFWGIGHTITLLIIGVLVLILQVSVPQNLTIFLEGLVGVMLIFLGIKVFKKDQSKPFKYKTSFFAGFVHGLAGSGALMLLVLSTIPGILEGLYYIFIFGLGSILGMSLMSLALSIPLLFLKGRLPELENYLKKTTSILSILLGTYLVYKASLGLF